jgi:hypothetical protein
MPRENAWGILRSALSATEMFVSFSSINSACALHVLHASGGRDAESGTLVSKYWRRC